MKTKKLTAVEFIHNFIDSSCEFHGSRITLNPDLLFDCMNKAKQMEKEQIEEAYNNGGEHYTEYGKAILGEDYYNETYGK
jgi:hypothetical protein